MISATKIHQWQEHGCHTLNPASAGAIAAVVEKVGPLPDDLHSLYLLTNGLSYEWFEIIPIEDPSNIKHTWNGLAKANVPTPDNFFGQMPELTTRFLAFARLDAGRNAFFDRVGGSIWFEEDEEIHQTNLSLCDFVDVVIREVDEL